MFSEEPFKPPFFSIVDMVRLHGQSRPEDIAFMDRDTALTWKEFDEEINQLANALHQQGLKIGERVAVLTGNSLWAYKIIFGVLRAGGVICPLSGLLTSDILSGLVQDCDARFFFVEEDYRELGEETFRNASTVMQRSPNRVFESAYGEFIASYERTDPGIEILPDDRCNVIYSSGTTGIPKGIVHSHGARVGFAAEMGLGLRVHSHSRTLVTTPPSSNGAWLVFLPTVMVGATTIAMGAFSGDALVNVLKEKQPTHGFMVPTQMRALLEHPVHKDINVEKLECIVSSGAPIPQATKLAIREFTGEKLFELYGFSESVGTIISPREMQDHPDSVGRPWMGCELRIVDDTGKDITGKGVGEIVGRTISMMEGYLNRLDASRDLLWRDDNGDVFFRTGDLGEIVENGYLYVRGRAKDMIISGGLNIFPVDIEAIMLQHAAIKDVSVVGITDEKWGETPVGFVVLHSSALELGVTEDDIKIWINEKLAKFQRLSAIVLQENDFPRNALGKVLKNQLKENYESKLL